MVKQRGGQPLLVSIVTPSLNQARFLEDAIVSVRSQKYPKIEYIVMDGGSQDGSHSILRKNEDFLTWLTEPDRGQAHAVNKGFQTAKGEILAWLNADDLYTENAIETVVEYFNAHPEADLVYGDALAIDEKRRSYGPRMNVRHGSHRDLVHETDFIVQPAAFWRKKLWQEFGPLREDLTYTMDYDFWIRASQKSTLHYLERNLAMERIHPRTKSFQGGVARMEELERMIVSHGGTGIPSLFRPEAASAYFQRGLGNVLRGKWRQALDDLSRVGRLSSSSKTLLYISTTLLLGSRRIPLARLVSNFFRSKLYSRARRRGV